MEWSDESYVRLYTRDTTDWKLWPWQARCVFVLLLRKVDRAGVFDCGKHSPIKAVAAQLDLPLELVSEGLPSLLEDGCVIESGSHLVIRSFIEAQTAVKSDKLRAKEARTRRRSESIKADSDAVTNRNEAVTNRDADVTKRDDSSRGVTRRHAASRGVTLSLAQPSLDTDTSTSRQAADVRLVFDHWCQVMGKRGDTKLTGDRRSKIKARLRDGYTVEQLCQAIDGCKASPFHMGENDRNTAYNDLATIMKQGSTVEAHIARVVAVGADATADGQRPGESFAEYAKRKNAEQMRRVGLA